MSRPLRWLLILLGCVSCRRPATAPPPSETTPPVRVLFIGNSYTSVNDLPGMLGGFARALSPQTRLETVAVMPGGATLESHWKGSEARERLHGGAWDEVVLQEQSLLGNLSVDGAIQMSPPEDRFFPYARLFAQEITAAKATPVFFMTWSRKANLPAQRVLTWAYTHIAREQHGVLSPVGVAWQRVRQERPELELYNPDGNHPSPAGTYLAACVLYTSLFHKSCLGAPSTPLVQLPEETARYLQQVGSEVGLAPELPETELPRPDTVHLPTLPRGTPWDAGRATGSWRGTLAFFPSNMGLSPVPLELTLNFQGARPSGRVRILFPQRAPLEADVVPGVENDVLTFTLRDTQLLQLTLTFRAVLTEDGLRGVTTAEDDQYGRWFGSWSAQPASN